MTPRTITRKIICFAMLILLVAALAACGAKEAPKPTEAPAAPTEAPAEEPAAPATEDKAAEPAAEEKAAEPAAETVAWPDDASVAYCPPLTASAPNKVVRQDKAYIVTFEGMELADYQAYAEVLKADAGITVISDYNTRGNAYTLNAQKADDAALTIRVTLTVPTQIMQVAITHGQAQ